MISREKLSCMHGRKGSYTRSPRRVLVRYDGRYFVGLGKQHILFSKSVALAEIMWLLFFLNQQFLVNPCTLIGQDDNECMVMLSVSVCPSSGQ